MKQALDSSKQTLLQNATEFLSLSLITSQQQRLSIDVIDERLNDFIRSNQKRIIHDVKYKLAKFNDEIRQQELWMNVKSHNLKSIRLAYANR